MTSAERYLYHQIHPLKLATDWAAGLALLYPLWQHQLLLGLLVMLVPPPLASVLVIRFADLARQKQSAFGHYLARYMTLAAQVARLLGMLAMAIGAWRHSPVLMAAGLIVILAAWMRGLVFPGKA